MQGALGSPGKLKGFCFYLWFVFQPRPGDATSWSSHQLETWAPSERLQSPGGELLHQPLKQSHGGRGRSGESLWKPERLVSLESLPPTLLHMHPCPWYSCRLIQLLCLHTLQRDLRPVKGGGGRSPTGQCGWKVGWWQLVLS